MTRAQVDAATALGVDWITWLRDVRLSPETTWKTYTKTLIAWMEWCTTRPDIDPLAPELDVLEAFTRRPRKGGRLGSPATRKRETAALRSWYRWLVNRRKIEHNPAAALLAPEVTSSRGNPIPAEDWMRLWPSLTSAFTIVAIGLPYFAGLRTCEVADVRPGHGSLGSDLVTVRRKGGEIQAIPWLDLATLTNARLPHLLPDLGRLVGAVRTVRADSSGCILRPGNVTQLRAMLRTACKRVGIREWTPHRLRDSFATNMLSPEINMRLEDVADLLGQKRLEQVRTYTPPASLRLRERFPELSRKSFPAAS